MSRSLSQQKGQGPLNVLHVCSSLSVESGGVARAVLDSLLALAKAGAGATVVSYEGKRYDFPWRADPPPNLKVVLCPRPKNSAHWASQELRSVIKDQLPAVHVVHLHGMWEPLMASVARLAVAGRVPYVCSIHGMLDPWSIQQGHLKKRIYYALVERKRLSRSAAIHFTAEQEKRKASRWTPPHVKPVVIPIIMDLGPYKDLCPRDTAHAHFPDIPPDKPWVLFLSRIHEKKGLDLLIQAVARLNTRDTQLVIAGTGDESYVNEMRRLAATLGIGTRTHFVGIVQGAAKVALYRRASMLVLPSSQENFGIVVTEALACETPVLLTKDVDIHEEVLAAQAGALICRDPADIAHRIDAFLANPALAKTCGEAGRRWVFQALDPQTIATRWLDVYTSIKDASHSKQSS